MSRGWSGGAGRRRRDAGNARTWTLSTGRYAPWGSGKTTCSVALGRGVWRQWEESVGVGVTSVEVQTVTRQGPAHRALGSSIITHEITQE